MSKMIILLRCWFRSQLGPVAQRLEQRTHNPLVESSNLSGPKLSRSILVVSLDRIWQSNPSYDGTSVGKGLFGDLFLSFHFTELKHTLRFTKLIETNSTNSCFLISQKWNKLRLLAVGFQRIETYSNIIFKEKPLQFLFWEGVAWWYLTNNYFTFTNCVNSGDALISRRNFALQCTTTNTGKSD